MRRTLIVGILWFILIGSIIAQEGERSTGVELPDFVITGKESFELPRATKQKPPVFSTLSEEFIKPAFSPDLLDVQFTSDPLRIELTRRDSLRAYNNVLRATVGNHYLPFLDFRTELPLDGMKLRLGANGFSKTAFVENAEVYSFTPDAEFSYTGGNNAGIFKDHLFSLRTDYSFIAYKDYKSANWRDRKLNFYDLSVSLQAPKNQLMQYGAGFYTELTTYQPVNLRETSGALKGYLGFNSYNFIFQPNAEYRVITTKDSVARSIARNFLYLRAPVRVTISDKLDALAGLDFMQFDTIKTLSPSFGLVLQLKKGIFIQAKYGSEYRVDDLKQVLGRNRYFSPLQIAPALQKVDNKLSASVKYEYEKMLEIIGGLGFASADNFTYFEESLTPGLFHLRETEVKLIEANLKVLLNPENFGYFSADMSIRNVSDTSGNTLPFEPGIMVEAEYGRKLNTDIFFRFNVAYIGKRYTDRANKQELDPSVIIGLEGEYLFTNEFLMTVKINNLLNKNNFHWSGYRDEPFNVRFGLVYRW